MRQVTFLPPGRTLMDPRPCGTPKMPLIPYPQRLPLPGLLVLSLLGACSAPGAGAGMAEGPQESQPPRTMPDIVKMEFEISIAAPVELVWETMLDQESYRRWTEPFSVGSYYEGSWEEGEKMRFLGPGETGMLAVIAENRHLERLSIRHIGMVVEGVEDTTSEAVTSWAPAHESYSFARIPDGTRVTIEQEVLPGSEEQMEELWGASLRKLKELCESAGGEGSQ